jgi:hypothetical protein
MTLLRKKLIANQRRLRRPDRLQALEAVGVQASALGTEAHEMLSDLLRQATARSAPQLTSASAVAQKLETFGTGDLVILLDWHVEDEPAFIAARGPVANAVIHNPEFFGLDGFIAVDGAKSEALFIDIDEHGQLVCEEAPLEHLGNHA